MTLRADLPVIRMGLAPEEELAAALLAGPWDPELGARVMARTLLLHVRQALAARGLRRICRMEAPRRCQGFFWGARGELRASWSRLGLASPPRWIAEEQLRIEAVPFPEAELPAQEGKEET